MDLFSLLCETNLVPEVFLIESYTINTDKKDYEKSLFFSLSNETRLAHACTPLTNMEEKEKLLALY